jgi:hypothetical protein
MLRIVGDIRVNLPIPPLFNGPDLLALGFFVLA